METNLLLKRLNEPLVTKEIAGHVDVPIIHQHTVFL